MHAAPYEAAVGHGLVPRGSWACPSTRGPQVVDAARRYFEDIYFDIDNDGPWDTNLWNARGSEDFMEVLDFDMDENDAWDRWRGYTRRIIPGSNVDNVRRSNRQNASNRLIYDYRQRTGMSLLYPNLPGGY